MERERREKSVKEAVCGIITGIIFVLFFLGMIWLAPEQAWAAEYTTSSEVPMEADLQIYLQQKCDLYDIDYAFALGTIEQESRFTQGATGYNKNGTVDRGICQINSGWIKKLKRLGYITQATDLYDPYKCIDCGMYLLWLCTQKFGSTEAAYYMYNTGKEKAGSNKSSRAVWQYTQKWREILKEDCDE